MSQVRFSIAHNKASLEESKHLPYSVWHAVLHKKGREPDTVEAWVAYGDPLTPAQAEAVRDKSRSADAAGNAHPLLAQAAKAHRDRIDGKPPTFTIYSQEKPLRPMCVVQPEAPAGEKRETYVVKDERGQALARISKGRSPLGLRRAWRIELTGAGDAFVGYRGTWHGWLWFLVFLPLWIPLTLVSIVVGILDSGNWDDLTWEPPKRTVWRQRSGGLLASAVLDRRSSSYRWDSANLDARVAYAQAVLRQAR
ncbi:hypothetical protein [Streptomyces sp. NPDC006134]|uniref:hypothetical protein n=1 Tax=Streptomyces sp. NPDC006134 TaxID=3154467 RepID=UPI0033C90541